MYELRLARMGRADLSHGIHRAVDRDDAADTTRRDPLDLSQLDIRHSGPRGAMNDTADK